MTSVSSPGSSSPRWDSRNQGFISPAQLQQWRQHEQRHALDIHSQPPPAPQPDEAQTRPAPLPPSNGGATAGHGRTMSAFSLFGRARQSHDGALEGGPAHASGTIQPQQPDTQADEFGRPRRTPSSSQQNAGHTDTPSSAPALSPRRSSTAMDSGLMRSTSASAASLHPEIRSIVQLTVAHGQKVYYSGPLVRRVERQPDGQKPAKDEGWRDVWAQLGGTTLSVWDMKAIEEANREGRQVPPTYVNVTDAFANVLGSVTVPATSTSPPKRYTNVLTLNTAGSNLLLFSCPSAESLIAWAAALRLSAWEKSRLEEIYTAHLIRITLNDGRSWPSPLTQGRMEGWVGIRVAGQTDWKRMWMVVTSGGHSQDGASLSSLDQTNAPASPSVANSPTAPRKKRMSNLFSRERSPQRPSPAAKPSIQLLASPKPKDRKKPLLTMSDLSQAFAVYPERPDLISRSTLMKLEGKLGDEEVGSNMKMRDCWLLVMPEFEGQKSRASEMLKWLIGIHDAFELYGRPQTYTWDPRDPRSMMFAYPIGPSRDLLFLDRELAETVPVQDDRTPAIRSRLQNILLERMRNPGMGTPPTPSAADRPPILPPLNEMQPHDAGREPNQPQTQRGQSSMQLPPFNFGSNSPLASNPNTPPAVPEKRVLTPITERSVPRDPSRSLSGENALLHASSTPSTVAKNFENGLVSGQPLTSSPEATSPASDGNWASQGSYGATSQNRESERMGYSAHGRTQSRCSFGSTTLPHDGSTNLPPPKFDTHSLANRPRNVSPPAMSSPTTSSEPSTSGRMHSPRPTHSGTELSSVYSQPSPTQQSPPASTRAASQTYAVSPSSPPATATTSPKKTSQPPAPSHRSPVTIVPGPIPVAPKPKPHPTSKANTGPVAQQPPAPTQPLPALPPKEDADEILGGSHALQFMRQMDEESGVVAVHRRSPPPVDEEDEPDTPTSSSESEGYVPPPRARASPLQPQPQYSPRPHMPSSPPRRATSTSTTSSQTNASTAASASGAPRSGVIRKPSGARAPTVGKKSALARNSFALDRSPDEHVERSNMGDSDSDLPYSSSPPAAHEPNDAGFDDPADALAALTFLEQEDTPADPPSRPATTEVPSIVEPESNPSTDSVDKKRYRSSFAPSRQAAERKAKSQAQLAASQVAAKTPGKAHGRRPSNTNSRGWAESSEEEEEEEEEDDDDADSDEQPPPRAASRSAPNSGPGSAAPSISGRPGFPPSRGTSPSRFPPDANSGGFPQGQRRELPQVPGQPGQRYTGVPEDFLGGPPRRIVSDQYSDSGRRSYFPEGPRQPPQGSLRPMSEYPQAQFQPQPQMPRQNMWSQVLDPRQNIEPTGAGNRDTFVQIEPPEQSMTKAFTPHGLLSAGLQDRQDRSAKRQEELARETGASLINVPNKPPPPQTGLLGAVTAHERERKRDGGIGATLTEREREKRMAEERQRKLDDYQRQQLDQMQQGGSMYGGMGMQGFNPMMANPMMMGMNPMMTGGWGYPGMMPGYGNPMFAAQQAAMQAYQQAMMAYSGGGSPGEGGQALNPMMTGGSMGMLDPRMSMMGMPMMSPSMGMNPGMGMGGGMMGLAPQMTGGMSQGMGMGMPMGMGMGMGGNMGMQPTGGSGFDPQFSPSRFDAGMHPPEASGSGPRPFSSSNGSPAQGSPAGPRAVDPPPLDERPTRTGDAS